MSCRTDFENLNNSFGTEENYASIDEKKQDLLDKQVTNSTTKIQRELADKLVRESSKFKGVNKENYIDSSGNTYMRATTFMQKLRNGFYSFDDKNYNEEDSSINIEWGNTVDTALEGIILGKSNEEIEQDLLMLANGIELSVESIDAIKKQVEEIKKLHPGAIFLPQLTVSSDIGVAGSIDLPVIEPNGDITIYDLKSSINPITKPWTRTSAYGTEYSQTYDKVFTLKDGSIKASVKQKHNAQLNLYKSMIENTLGVEVKNIGIIPAHITVGETGLITGINFEPLKMHDSDNSLLKSMKELDTREEIINNLTDLSNTGFLQEIVRILETEINILRKQGKNESIPKITAIMENIQMGEGMSRLSEFIEYMYDEFVTSDSSIRKRFNELIERVNNNELSNEEVLSELDLFKSEIDLFRGVVTKLQSLNDEDLSNDSENGSNADKLNQIINEFNTIDRLKNNKIIPIIANILSQQLPSDISKQKLLKTIQTYKKKLQKRNLTDSRRKKVEQELREIEKRYNESESSILEALRTGNYQDISVLSSNLNPAISVDNTIIATFAKTLKENFEKMRISLLGIEKDAAQVFERFKAEQNKKGIKADNVSEFNKDFYEIIEEDGKEPYYALVQELDYPAYKAAMDNLKSEASEAAARFHAAGKYNNYSRKELTKKLMNEKAVKMGYLVGREANDTVINGVVIRKGYKNIIKENKEKFKNYPEQYSRWYLANFSEDSEGNPIPKGRSVMQPNAELFRNKKYDSIMSDPSKEEYYKFLVSTYFEAQNLIGGYDMMYRLPGIEKIGRDRISEQGIKGWFSRWKEGLTDYLPNEEEEYGSEIKKRIPHYYSQNIGIENTSLDLMSSILTYTAAAHRYAAQSRMEPVANALLNIVSEKGPMHSAETPLNKLNIGNQPLSEYFRKHKSNNTAAMLEALIDMHIYGKTRLKSELGGFKWNKIVDGTMGFASITQIGGNPVLAVANSMAAHISSAIDAYANEHFTTKTWMWAKAEYRKHEKDFWTDMIGSTKKSLIGQLTEVYDALQGEYFDKYGRKMTQSGVKKMWGSSLWFAGMHKGEHSAQVKVMMSVLKDTMVTTKDGGTISLYDAYELDSNGKIKVKDNVDTELINMDALNTIHSLNKRFNGVYNSFDKPLIERHNLGILIMMYRKFIAPNVRRRFKGYGIDYESGTEYEGYYRTFFDKMINERDEVWKLLTKQSHTLTDHEVANLKRMLAELTYMGLLSSLVALMGAALDGDDDDLPLGLNLALQYSMYWSMRAMSELSFYNFGMGSINTFGLPLNPGGTLRSFRTPSPIYSVFEKSFRALRHTGMLIGGNDKAYYKRDMQYKTIFGNLAERGDNKALVSWMKLMGFNGNTFNIENAIKILDMYD